MRNCRLVVLAVLCLITNPGSLAGESGSDVAGFIGPEGPPMNPSAWYKVEGDVLPLDRVWGSRVSPTGGVFRFPGGIGLLYNSKPPDGWTGGAAYQTGSLAFSSNLLDWHDYPGNPVLYETADGTGTHRAYPQAMLYDDKNSQWVVYLGFSRGDFPGLRAVGTTFSTDLLNWKQAPGTTLTIDDFSQAVPERMHATPEQLRKEGRVYAIWAIFHQGKYYIAVSGTTHTGEDLPGQPDSGARSYARVILEADSPTGPFRKCSDCRGDFIPESKPLFWKGKWYTVVRGTWNGKRGFGLAYSDSLTGPYEMNPQNPIVELETMARAHPNLFRYNGVWAIIYSHQHTTDDMPMRMVISDMHPDLIRAMNDNMKH